jgi:hypothetical protein
MNRSFEYTEYGEQTTGNPFTRLNEVMRTERYLLEALTVSPNPLTVEQLNEIDPILAQRASEYANGPLLWPTSETAVSVADDSSLLELFGDDDDRAFVTPILADGSDAYNNFFLRIKTPHNPPSEQAAARCLQQGNIVQFAYSMNVYTDRAYTLVPEFMTALQQATADVGSMERWNDTMVEGLIDPEYNPDKATLLTASRTAYVLLSRLMRTDDRKIQFAMMRLPADTASIITDPVDELRM